LEIGGLHNRRLACGEGVAELLLDHGLDFTPAAETTTDAIELLANGAA
jgi:hypothetical protein